MIAKKEGWNIVLGGMWNRAIFMPPWVLPKLFPDNPKTEDTVHTEVALLHALPLVYRDSEVAVEISGGRLLFRPVRVEDGAVERCERMARQMLTSLPDTPIHAVAINFRFRETAPPGHVLAMFSSVDDMELEQQDWAIGERKFIRQMKRGKDTLGLAVTFDGEAVEFAFSFHNEPESESNAWAAQAVEEGRVLRLRDVAVDLLRNTYQLEIEEADEA